MHDFGKKLLIEFLEARRLLAADCEASQWPVASEIVETAQAVRSEFGHDACEQAGTGKQFFAAASEESTAGDDEEDEEKESGINVPQMIQQSEQVDDENEDQETEEDDEADDEEDDETEGDDEEDEEESSDNVPETNQQSEEDDEEDDKDEEGDDDSDDDLEEDDDDEDDQESEEQDDDDEDETDEQDETDEEDDQEEQTTPPVSLSAVSSEQGLSDAGEQLLPLDIGEVGPSSTTAIASRRAESLLNSDEIEVSKQVNLLDAKEVDLLFAAVGANAEDDQRSDPSEDDFEMDPNQDDSEDEGDTSTTLDFVFDTVVGEADWTGII